MKAGGAPRLCRRFFLARFGELGGVRAALPLLGVRLTARDLPSGGESPGAIAGAYRLQEQRCMGVPISQMWTVSKYVLSQKLRGNRRYPLVLMLEPLFRCNLACAGCGKIQYPAHILKKQLTPEQCFSAVEECGAPRVSIPGGEPLLHPLI
jgi:hypothetical protein